MSQMLAGRLNVHIQDNDFQNWLLVGAINYLQKLIDSLSFYVLQLKIRVQTVDDEFDNVGFTDESISGR